MWESRVGETVARATRGGVSECRYTAHIAVASSRDVVARLGDPGILNPLRSTAKPFIVEALLPWMDSNFDRDLIALACSSHSGEPVHVNKLREALSRFELQEDWLQLGTHPPLTPNLVLEPPPTNGLLTSKLQNNCSGKHVALMILARLIGQPPRSYLQEDGKTAAHLRDHFHTIAQRVGSPAYELVDGCGAPTSGMSLGGIAQLYAQFCSHDASKTLVTIRNAMLTRPSLVGGIERVTTAILEHGIIAKEGFDGLYAMAFQGAGGESYGVAIKVDSGSDIIAQAIALAAAQVISEKKIDCSTPSPTRVLYNQLGKKTGELQVDVEKLYKTLSLFRIGRDVNIDGPRDG